MLHDQTAKYIQALPDRDLAEYIVTGVQMYEPEAVEFAWEEFERRKLDPALLLALHAAAEKQWAEQMAHAQIRAAAPLDWEGKVFAFVTGFFFPLTLSAIHCWLDRLHDRGERRKARQWLIYASLGAAIMIAFLVFAIIEYGDRGEMRPKVR